MPRITSKKKDYKLTDFRRWLIGEIKVQGYKQSEVAEWLGISQQAVSAKLKSGSFSLKELLILFEKLNTEQETIGKLLKV